MISGKKYKEMAEEFLHGVNVIEVTSGAKTVRTAKSSVIGVIGTAPEADEQKFPLNKPVLVAGSLKEAAKLGKSGSLPSAINGIFSQIGATVVVIRVKESENSDPKLKESETIQSIIGGVDKETGEYQGIEAFLSSESIVHVAPRILIAPQFTHQLPEIDGVNSVVSALISIAEKLTDQILMMKKQ